MLSRDVNIVEDKYLQAQLEQDEQIFGFLGDLELNANQTPKPLSSPNPTQASRDGESGLQVDDSNSSKENPAVGLEVKSDYIQLLCCQP